MAQEYIRHRQRPLPSSAGKVNEVFLIETEGTHDLPYFLHWIKLARVKKGILLLVDVEPDATARAILDEIGDIGIDIFSIHFADRDLSSALSAACSQSPPNSFALPATDLMLTCSDGAYPAHRTLYIGTNSRYDYSSLRHHSGFRAALRRMGIETIASADRGTPLIEGGDYLLVGDHLFLGMRTQQHFGIDAPVLIRQYYDLCERIDIHFIGVPDPDPALGLYHLDLYFTYAGMDTEGRHRFFIGYMDDNSIGDTVITSMRAQLDTFRQSIISILDTCFPGRYELVPVPIICCDVYRVSPLNGIIDYIDGIPTYYFPWPEFVNALAHPHYDTQQRITASMQRAYDIIADKMGAANVVPFKVPIGYTTGSGQSLHCTMAVIGREDL